MCKQPAPLVSQKLFSDKPILFLTLSLFPFSLLFYTTYNSYVLINEIWLGNHCLNCFQNVKLYPLQTKNLHQQRQASCLQDNMSCSLNSILWKLCSFWLQLSSLFSLLTFWIDIIYRCFATVVGFSLDAFKYWFWFRQNLFFIFGKVSSAFLSKAIQPQLLHTQMQTHKHTHPHIKKSLFSDLMGWSQFCVSLCK